MNFELLRILSIVSIVFCHIGSGGHDHILCYLGDVNCFILISGYFLINGKFKFSRILRLAVETIFYSMGISLGFYLLRGGEFIEIIKSFPFAPIRYSYWFINRFIGLLLLQPFISKLILQLNRRQYTILLGIMYLLFSHLTIFFPFSQLFTNGYSLAWMITVFLTGGYIRLYNPFANFKHWGWVWLASVAVFYFGYRLLGSIAGGGYNQWFYIGRSFCLFMFVRSLNISSKSIFGKIIGFISPNVLSIYLIQEQPLMKHFMISTGFENINALSLSLTLTLWTIYTFAIIIACSLVDKLRIFIFNQFGITKSINSISKKIDTQLSLQ